MIDTDDAFHRGLLAASDGGEDPRRRLIFSALREPSVAAHLWTGPDDGSENDVRLAFNASASVVADAVLAALEAPPAARGTQ